MKDIKLSLIELLFNILFLIPNFIFLIKILGTFLSTIIKDFLKFDTELKDLDQIVQDKNSDKEMIDMAEKDLDDLKVKKKFVRAN